MRGARAAGGFTLVEVLVALFVMALMSALAWRGIDGLLRTREGGRDAIDATVRLTTLVSQWETDLQSLQGDAGVPTLAWDGRTLRLVRRAETGVQMVAWSQRGSTWTRWASPATTSVGELQQAWLRSQQLQDDEPGQIRLLDDLLSWQVYCWRASAWTNCQSTGDQESTVSAAPAAATGASGSASGAAAAASAAAGAASAAGTVARVSELLPGGIRLVLQFEGRSLVRDIALAPAS